MLKTSNSLIIKLLLVFKVLGTGIDLTLYPSINLNVIDVFIGQVTI